MTECFVKRIQKEVFKISKKEFNIASPKQLGVVLFENMKLVDKPKKTKTELFCKKLLKKRQRRFVIVERKY